MILINILIFLISCHAVTQDKKQPNIIFILADDLGWSDVSWNNKRSDTTPFMASLMNNATRFSQVTISIQNLHYAMAISQLIGNLCNIDTAQKTRRY